MRHSIALGVLLAVVASTPVVTQRAPSSSMAGFAAGNVAKQREAEQKFDSLLRADNLRDWMKRMSARPHHLGSPYGRENAEFMAGLFKSWGYEAEIVEYQVLFPTPTTRVVELVAPTKFVASLSEPALKEDATSGQKAEQLPVFNSYSIDGDVTADVVYVNYGVPADYEELERRGVDVKGKIVIARYGGSWRGIKPKVAAEHGAIGCLIYSDPRDDGYFQGEPYPGGGWRPERGAQRGSVADMPVYPGDPLTPGVGATKDAKRPPFKEAQTLTRIPVLPISYADALPILKAINGPMAPAGWRGALDTPYRLGPGPARVHLKLQFDWKLVPLYDVVATLRGSELPDQWIVRGNHHDAWVNGASDPVSGMVVVLEEARALGELVKAGWKPRRTIVFAGWDGEEPGLLGSTEWVEANADTLRSKAVVYINSDSNSAGFLDAGGSHSLETLVNEVAREVAEPRKEGLTVADRMLAGSVVRGSNDDRALARDKRLFAIDALGSGSDYTPFLQHLGIASLSIGFGGEDDYGQYHSIYDSFDHYTRFMDPDFRYGVALAKTAGRLVMRFANADLLPFEFERMSATVSSYAREVEALADTFRAETIEHNRRVDDGAFVQNADPRYTYVAPKRLNDVPYLNFAPLKNAVGRLDAAASRFARANRDAFASNRPTPEVRKSVDEMLMQLERALTRNEGLPSRPWFKHQVYAPGLYTGYGVKTLPAIREAIEQRQWKEAGDQIAIVAGVLDGYAAALERTAGLLEPSSSTAQR